MRIAYQEGEPSTEPLAQAERALHAGLRALVLSGDDLPTRDVMQIDDLAAAIKVTVPQMPILRSTWPEAQGSPAEGVAMIRLAQQLGGDGATWALAARDVPGDETLDALADLASHFSVNVAVETEDKAADRAIRQWRGDVMALVATDRDVLAGKKFPGGVPEELGATKWLCLEHTTTDADQYADAVNMAAQQISGEE